MRVLAKAAVQLTLATAKIKATEFNATEADASGAFDE
jgi:hypothetical protein